MRYVLTDINRGTATVSDPEEAAAVFKDGIFTFADGTGESITVAPEGGDDELPCAGTPFSGMPAAYIAMMNSAPLR
jgi:hypothetical protein